MFPFTNYLDAINRQTNQFISDIEQAINGEYSAIDCYAKLANLAGNKQEREQILEIRQDEIKHYHHFVQIYQNLTGRQPQPKIIEDCPNTYLAGLEFALQDEQKTVDFYLDISDKSTDPYIKEAFQRAAKDEQSHAVWFLYYYVKAK
ncbi:ferritin family protein [Neobacillus dielmonensis]|uniref:ferritin family protein n=1 Tax=Neobacillus dielmonensis TaxID=1347369 RepID=UPI0005AB510B|nr:ferritin-like domain-containing protein [Neobacillus dielmonensis]